LEEVSGIKIQIFLPISGYIAVMSRTRSVQISELDGTWRASIDRYASACRDLDLLT